MKKTFPKQFIAYLQYAVRERMSGSVVSPIWKTLLPVNAM